MMDGSYFDRMSPREIKQQVDAQIAGAHRELEEKDTQQRRESLRFTSGKGEIIRANTRWTSARKEEGRSTINAINTIPISLYLD